jgi:hypothetical protein
LRDLTLRGQHPLLGLLKYTPCPAGSSTRKPESTPRNLAIAAGWGTGSEQARSDKGAENAGLTVPSCELPAKDETPLAFFWQLATDNGENQSFTVTVLLPSTSSSKT